MPTYYLWLAPDGDSYDRLSQLINQLCERYRGPRFDPHMTLWGEVVEEESTMCQHIQVLAQRLRPLTVCLQEAMYEDEYFRCLYFPIEKAQEIMDARSQVSHVLNKESTALFRPHISLLYGLYPLRVKQEIISALPVDIPNPFILNQLQLIRADSTNPEDWHVVLSLPV